MILHKSTCSWSLLSLVSYLFLTGCSELQTKDTLDAFNHATHTYKASLRWGEWHNALSMYRQKPKDSDTPQQDSINQAKATDSEAYLKHLSTIKITRVESLSEYMGVDNKVGESNLSIEYHFDNSVRVHKLSHKVSWWHDKENKQWFTNTPLPKAFDLPKEKTLKMIKLTPDE